MRKDFLAAVALTLAALSPALAHDYQAGSILIEHPWTRATPPGAKVAGGFMKLQNTGKEPDRLIGGSAAVAGKFEVHEMAMVNNVMKMRELENGIEIKPGQNVELKPGSFHVMFMDLKQQIKEGDRVKGTLVFEKAGTVEVEFKVEAMGAKAGSPGMKH
jgi:hypothetical protein